MITEDLPQLPTPEEVYDLDTFQIKDVNDLIENHLHLITNPQWLKRANKLKGIIHLELEERKAIENFGEFCMNNEYEQYFQQTSVVQNIAQTNLQLQAILNDIQNRPANYLDFKDGDAQNQNTLPSIEETYPKENDNETTTQQLSSSQVTDFSQMSKFNKMKNNVQNKKKEMHQYMKEILAQTKVTDNKMVVGSSGYKYIPPPKQPELTATEKVKLAKLNKQNAKTKFEPQQTKNIQMADKQNYITLGKPAFSNKQLLQQQNQRLKEKEKERESRSSQRKPVQKKTTESGSHFISRQTSLKMNRQQTTNSDTSTRNGTKRSSKIFQEPSTTTQNNHFDEQIEENIVESPEELQEATQIQELKQEKDKSQENTIDIKQTTLNYQVLIPQNIIEQTIVQNQQIVTQNQTNEQILIKQSQQEQILDINENNNKNDINKQIQNDQIGYATFAQSKDQLSNMNQSQQENISSELSLQATTQQNKFLIQNEIQFNNQQVDEIEQYTQQYKYNQQSQIANNISQENKDLNINDSNDSEVEHEDNNSGSHLVQEDILPYFKGNVQKIELNNTPDIADDNQKNEIRKHLNGSLENQVNKSEIKINPSENFSIKSSNTAVTSSINSTQKNEKSQQQHSVSQSNGQLKSNQIGNSKTNKNDKDLISHNQTPNMQEGKNIIEEEYEGEDDSDHDQDTKRKIEAKKRIKSHKQPIKSKISQNVQQAQQFTVENHFYEDKPPDKLKEEIDQFRNQEAQIGKKTQVQNSKIEAIEKPKKPRVPPAPRPKQNQGNNQQSKYIVKMMLEINDDQLYDYSLQIPTFQHLFSGYFNTNGNNYSHLDSMREIYQLFHQHIDRVDNVDLMLAKFKPGVSPLQLSPNEIVYINDPKKIMVYASKTGIDIQSYIQRQITFNKRLSGDEDPQKNPQKSLYFRVIKTKEEVYDIITRSFMRKPNWSELPHGISLKTSWNVLWTWSKPQIDMNKLLLFQKNLSRKDLLKKNIERCQRLGPKAQQCFDIVPSTFLLPKEYVPFIERFYSDQEQEGPYNIWIMKPTSKSRGRGISIMYAEPVILQKYLKNPLLLRGYKFDMRIYVLVTSVNPLEAFIYKEGFARLTTQPFSLDLDDLKNTLVHLTNYAIQRTHVPEGSLEHSFGGSKISLKQLKEKLQEKGIDWNNIWGQVQEIIIKSLVAAQCDIPHNPNSFELFGYDIIIDQEKKCWLLEVNASPSLAREYILDELVKQQLIDDIFDLLDPIHYDRIRLCEVLERRILEEQGNKSMINPMNNSKLQLNRDINYILGGRPMRKYGEMPQFLGGFTRLAPSETYDRVVKIVSSYKTTHARGTID